MADTVDLQALGEAAEWAAANDDYAGAERLLAQLVALQEARLGAEHPELANTLNNLGVVYERTDQFVEAERCYRRAHAIATATLGPGDPVSITSGQNLKDFCAARGKPVEVTVAPTAPPAEPAVVPAAPSVEVTMARTAPPTEIAVAPPVPLDEFTVAPTPPPAVTPLVTHGSAGATGGSFRLQVAAVAAFVVGLVAVGGYLIYGPQSKSDAPSPQPAGGEVRADVPSASQPSVTARAPNRPAPERGPALPARKPVQGSAPTPVPAAKTASPVAVVTAQMCRTLSTSTWQCAPLAGEASPGTLFYFTRVRSDRDTSVQHRWYFNGALVQSVALRVGRNQSSGYRTYSRNTIGPDRAGNWRVELRDLGGAVLDEKSFTVR